MKEFMSEVSRRAGVERMILFGSRASGKARADSDFDLLIVSSKYRNMNVFKRGTDLYHYWNLRYPVDFLCYSPEEFKKLKNDPTSIVYEVVRTGIEV